jgi:hypothetical protein
MFRRQVWGPVVCEITTQDVATSNCLEQHVRNAVLKSFVVECQEDYNLLYREVREKSNIPINIQVVHQGKSNPVERRYSDSKMEVLRREHGVKGYLDEVFTAPDAIMQALRNTSNVQSVLIGDDQTTTSLNRKGLMTYLNQREGSRKLQASCIFATDGQKTFKVRNVCLTINFKLINFHGFIDLTHFSTKISTVYLHHISLFRKGFSKCR